jgi:hypothetical protein
VCIFLLYNIIFNNFTTFRFHMCVEFAGWPTGPVCGF